MSEQTIVIILTIILGALNLVDWYTTRTILATGGMEANKFTAFVLRFINLDVYLASKAAFAVYVSYHLGFVNMKLLIAIIILYVFYMYRNWKHLKVS